MALLSRKEKEALVIKLAKEGKTIRQIAEVVHMSFKDIGKIVAKETCDDDYYLYQQQRDKEEEKEKWKQRKWKSMSPYARTFQMFKDKKTTCRGSHRTLLKIKCCI